jgi:hypothetical protein
VKFNSLRTSLVGTAFALIAAVLASCGGGGAESNNQGNALQILPSTATFYAGVENTLVVTGGRRPYLLVSSEPGLMPVPNRLSGTTFTVVPGNPGVIDVGLPPNSLPVRTVNVTVTDTNGAAATAIIRVAQNFLTGYGVSYTSNCPIVGTATTAPTACAGGETAVRIEPTFNGVQFGNRTLRLEIMRGPFSWVFPDGTIAGNTITVTTDHEGKTNAIFRVNTNVPTQLALFRVIDVETGVSTEELFQITGTPLAAQLAIVPNQFTFTGPDNTQCGTGSARFLVFDGLPPYTATSSFGNVTVSPASTDAQPGLFTFSVSDPSTCLTDATIVVTDSRLARGTLTITTALGTNDPPPLPLRVVPTTMALACGQGMSAIIAGGVSGATISATNPDSAHLTVTVSGNLITVTRLGTLLGLVDPTPLSGNVVVTDGNGTATIRVTYPTDCTP